MRRGGCHDIIQSACSLLSLSLIIIGACQIYQIKDNMVRDDKRHAIALTMRMISHAQVSGHFALADTATGGLDGRMPEILKFENNISAPETDLGRTAMTQLVRSRYPGADGSIVFKRLKGEHDRESTFRECKELMLTNCSKESVYNVYMGYFDLLESIFQEYDSETVDRNIIDEVFLAKNPAGGPPVLASSIEKIIPYLEFMDEHKNLYQHTWKYINTSKRN